MEIYTYGHIYANIAKVNSDAAWHAKNLAQVDLENAKQITTEVALALTHAEVQKQAELERIMAERVEEERLAMEDALHCQFDYLGTLPEEQQTEDDLAMAGNINSDKAEHF
jgi:hypothetical protein